jgi:hypothetical protein
MTFGVKQFSQPCGGIRGETLAVSATSVQSAVIGADLPAGTLVEVIICAFDVGCYVLVGPNPTATNTCSPVAAGASIRTSVQAGQRVAVLGRSGGSVSVYPEL